MIARLPSSSLSSIFVFSCVYVGEMNAIRKSSGVLILMGWDSVIITVQVEATFADSEQILANTDIRAQAHHIILTIYRIRPTRVGVKILN